jgi:hypothetical protein
MNLNFPLFQHETEKLLHFYRITIKSECIVESVVIAKTIKGVKAFDRNRAYYAMIGDKVRYI